MLSRDGNPATTDGRESGEGWVEQFSFTLDEVPQIDLVMSNHWTATAPNTRFTDLVVVSIVLPHGFAALTDRAYRRHSAGEDTTGTIDDPRVYRLRLSMLFGIDLSEEEVARLGLF
jgi:N-hydroxyarylamine O-acetyltransferase